MGYILEKWKTENGAIKNVNARKISDDLAERFIERTTKTRGTHADTSKVIEGLKDGWTFGLGNNTALYYTQEAKK